jgi:rRNA maturation RNase YbeY
MIQFSQQEIRFTLKSKLALKGWIKEIISDHKMKTGDINYIFCNDEYLLKINKQYLNHDSYTDIITFNYNEKSTINGDIFISIERVRDNMRKFNTTMNSELGRVMAHGILHLLGYKDKKREDKLTMRGKEEECISKFPLLDV